MSENKFKAGDRVRIASGPNNGGFGEVGDVGVVQFTSQSDCSVHFETGGRSGESWYVAHKHLEPLAAADSNGDQGGTLRLHEGGYYRTRDGRKVGPAYVEMEYFSVGGWLYDKDGSFVGASGEHHLDLIAEWQDDPEEATSLMGFSTVSGPAIVARLDNGQPLPARKPYVHASVADASKEAARLAKANPGREYAVYEMVHTVTEQPQHEWQRLAVEGKHGAAAVALQSMTGMRHTDALFAVRGYAA